MIISLTNTIYLYSECIVAMNFQALMREPLKRLANINLITHPLRHIVEGVYPVLLYSFETVIF